MRIEHNYSVTSVAGGNIRYLTGIQVFPFKVADKHADIAISIQIRRGLKDDFRDGVPKPDPKVVIKFPSFGSQESDIVEKFANGLLTAVSIARGLETEIAAGSYIAGNGELERLESVQLNRQSKK